MLPVPCARWCVGVGLVACVLGVPRATAQAPSQVPASAAQPTTPVTDLVVHPREDQIIAATHGRSLFLIDARPVQALGDPVRASDLHVLDVRPVQLTWQPGREVPPQPPRGRAIVHVWLKTAAELSATIIDAQGNLVRTLPVRGAAGVNRVVWDIRRDDGRDAPPGVYRIEVTAGSRKATGEIVVRPAGR